MNSLIKGQLNSFSELTSSGKSGSFFFYSIDGKYVLKTIKREEYVFLRKILKSYHEYVINNKRTLIPKFYSLNKISFDSFQLRTKLGYNRVYFVVMNNIFSKDVFINERYDLKGSTYKREVFPPHTTLKLEERKPIKIAMKDLDFIRRKKGLHLTGTQRSLLLQVLAKDCEFFNKQGIIDFSLLVGIHDKTFNNPEVSAEHSQDSSGSNFDDFSEDFENREIPTCFTFDSPNKKETYLLGIIDILTPFSSIKKKCEYAIKRICIGDSISCVPPKDYNLRFMNFMDAITNPNRFNVQFQH